MLSVQVFLKSRSDTFWSFRALLIDSLRPQEWITPLQFSDIYTGFLDFKILLNGLRPKYISEMLLWYKPSRPLRSSEKSLPIVPRVKTKHGNAAFIFYAPHITHYKLPENLKSAPTLSSLNLGLPLLFIRLILGLYCIFISCTAL